MPPEVEPWKNWLFSVGNMQYVSGLAGFMGFLILGLIPLPKSIKLAYLDGGFEEE
jgi:hypothetical protein